MRSHKRIYDIEFPDLPAHPGNVMKDRCHLQTLSHTSVSQLNHFVEL